MDRVGDGDSRRKRACGQIWQHEQELDANGRAVANSGLIAEFRGSVRSQRRDRSAAPHHRTPTRRNPEDAEDAAAAEPSGSSHRTTASDLTRTRNEGAKHSCGARAQRWGCGFRRLPRLPRSVVLRHHHASGSGFNRDFADLADGLQFDDPSDDPGNLRLVIRRVPGGQVRGRSIRISVSPDQQKRPVLSARTTGHFVFPNFGSFTLAIPRSYGAPNDPIPDVGHP